MVHHNGIPIGQEAPSGSSFGASLSSPVPGLRPLPGASLWWSAELTLSCDIRHVFELMFE